MSTDRIVAATLSLIDEKGIGAASMRAVGARLGVRAMSLYKHVANREQLLDAVVESIVNELGDDPQLQVAAKASGWRTYLAALACGVRRYAVAHPHAFPLVATRPAAAPWVNPPLRSLRWIEEFLRRLHEEGLTDEQIVFAYRAFNSFLLGYLLLETGAIALRDPQPGDGAYLPSPTSEDGHGEPGASAAADAIPGSLTPTRSGHERLAIAAVDRPQELIDPLGGVDGDRFPTVHRLGAGLAEDVWETEFEAALSAMLDRVERFMADVGTP